MAVDQNRKGTAKKIMYEEKERNADEVVFSSQNQRTAQRIDVEIEVTLTGPHTFFGGFTMDISEGGVFVATHQIFPIGTKFRMILFLGKEKLEIDSLVVWVRGEDSSMISGEEPGMGLKFIKLDERSYAVISEFIKKREPILYDDCL
ncbi:MAG TPA: PilZ domain-containing protein [bacterium]|nr:PilZ domain-containing protein [bacterium]